MSDMDSKGGEPTDPIETYDSQHGKPCEDPRLANPPVATAETEPTSFRVSK